MAHQSALRRRVERGAGARTARGRGTCNAPYLANTLSGRGGGQYKTDLATHVDMVPWAVVRPATSPGPVRYRKGHCHCNVVG